MSDTRSETDSLGSMEVPADALYGAQTARAAENFPISGWPMPRRFLAAMGLIKQSAAAVHRKALWVEYRKLATAYAMSGRADLLPKASKLAQNALGFFTTQQLLFEDADGGGDAFGREACRVQGVPERIAEVQAEIERYEARR